MRELSTQQTSVSADVEESLGNEAGVNNNSFREPTFYEGYYRYLTSPGDMDMDLRIGFYFSGILGIGAGAAAGGVLIAGSIAGASLVPVGGLATAATGVPTMAGNAVIGMGSAGLIGGTVSAIGGGNVVSGGVTAAPSGLVGGAAASVTSSLLARAGFSGLLGAITSDGFGGAAAAAVDSRLKGNTLGQTLTASFYGFVTGGTLRAGLHYLGPLVKQWWTNPTPNPVTPKGVRANKAAGDAWEAELLNNVLPKTQSQIQTQITIKSGGPSGKKVRLDAVGTDSIEGSVRLTDGKASATAPLTPNQAIVYPELEVHGGTVVGNGKPPYLGGTVIPPTKVDVIRKR